VGDFFIQKQQRQFATFAEPLLRAKY